MPETFGSDRSTPSAKDLDQTLENLRHDYPKFAEVIDAALVWSTFLGEMRGELDCEDPIDPPIGDFPLSCGKCENCRFRIALEAVS